MPFPRFRLQPESVRQFYAAKTGGNADVRIVQAHSIGAKERPEDAIKNLGEATAGRFARDNQTRGLAEFFAEGGQLAVSELMKDEVTDDARVAPVVCKRAQIAGVPRLTGRPVVGLGPKIKAVQVKPGSRQCGGEFASAGTEFENGLIVSRQRRQGAQEPAVISHHPIGQPQIAAVVQGVRMVRR